MSRFTPKNKGVIEVIDGLDRLITNRMLPYEIYALIRGKLLEEIEERSGQFSPEVVVNSSIAYLLECYQKKCEDQFPYSKSTPESQMMADIIILAVIDFVEEDDVAKYLFINLSRSDFSRFAMSNIQNKDSISAVAKEILSNFTADNIASEVINYKSHNYQFIEGFEEFAKEVFDRKMGDSEKQFVGNASHRNVLIKKPVAIVELGPQAREEFSSVSSLDLHLREERKSAFQLFDTKGRQHSK